MFFFHSFTGYELPPAYETLYPSVSRASPTAAYTPSPRTSSAIPPAAAAAQTPSRLQNSTQQQSRLFFSSQHPESAEDPSQQPPPSLPSSARQTSSAGGGGRTAAVTSHLSISGVSETSNNDLDPAAEGRQQLQQQRQQ